MKTILVPTDFSVSAQMATHYAASLANVTHATLILLHTYHINSPTGDVPLKSRRSPMHEKQQQKKMELQRWQLEEEYNIQVKGFVVPGLAAETVPEMAQSLNADLIVMGTKRSRDLTRNLIGSITTAVMGRSNVPLLVIPEGVVFEHPKEIVLATDFQAEPEKASFELLTDLARSFKANIRVLHIHENEVAVAEGPEIRLENALESVNHTYEMVVNDDTVQGIEQFLAETRPDWLVMRPHRYSFLERIFHRSCTRYMALHASLPLLMLR